MIKKTYCLKLNVSVNPFFLPTERRLIDNCHYLIEYMLNFKNSKINESVFKYSVLESFCGVSSLTNLTNKITLDALAEL